MSDAPGTISHVPEDDLDVCVDHWLASLGSDNTRQAYRRRLRNWLAWCATSGADPIHGSAETAECFLAAYELDSPIRKAHRSALYNWFAFLLRKKQIALNPLDVEPASCSEKGCDRQHYGLGYCRLHYRRFKANGCASIVRSRKLDEKECKYCHETKRAEEFVAGGRTCAACRSIDRRIRHERKIARGETKMCADCGLTMPLSEFTYDHAECRPCGDARKSAKQQERRSDPEKLIKCRLCNTDFPPAKFDPGYATCRDCRSIALRARRAEAAKRGATIMCRICEVVKAVAQFEVNSRVCTACRIALKDKQWTWRVQDGQRAQCCDCKLSKPLAEFHKRSARCKPCASAFNSRRWHADIEASRALRRERYLNNVERERARARRWSKSPQAREVRMRSYRRNRGRILGRNRDRYARDPSINLAASRAWKMRHPDLVKLASNKRRAKLLNAIGRHTEGEWRRIFRRYLGRCIYCGSPADARDHVLPLTRGGSDYASNLLPCCKSCNSSKKDRLLSEWRYTRAADGSIVNAPALRSLTSSKVLGVLP